MINIDNLLSFVKPYYENKDIMHNLSHIERVLKYVDKLLEAGRYQVDKDILTYAAYFHGFIYNSEESIVEWLKMQQVHNDIIGKIITVAWESQKDEEAVTLEGKILHDAHMIEGGKTYLIVKSLITGSVRGQTLEQTIKYIEDNVLDKRVCYLPEAQDIYRQQQQFAKSFISDLKEGLY
ncbi:hypothetical protein [Inconstantimicrobium mannanitabidum]|uniref:Uncharacterized protein n=1 Tax=Inconstantimicrobium mannanitabidum TaxID=1604901 RepID=A0ACB5RAM6_9CLOT|nr:hypothetical protein [Clostridium sp. TW13]GKX65919.1 hypothetical protein rsdtw13_11770 [Clostridium sp. TW13]